MNAYTVRQLAEMAGVSVRTLHHYDHIGLLKPSARTAAGYRVYGEEALLRLQQILFFRELDVPLSEIRSILDDPGFDLVEALEDHRRLLQARAERTTQLLKTIDKTIQRIKGEDMDQPVTDKELYEGFTPEQRERYEREVQERYDPALVRESQERVHKMTKGEWKAVQAEGEEVTRGLAALADRDPGDAEVQALIARHHAWIEQFYHASAEVYRGLGRLYVEHAEFRAHYEQYRPGMAEFMAAAMEYYAEHVLGG